MYARWALLLVATKGVGALGRIVDPQLPGFTSSHPFAPSDPEYVTFLRNVALPGLIFSALVAMAYVSYLFRLVLCSCCAGEKSEPEAPSASSRCAHVLIVLQLLCFSLVTGALVVALSGSSQFTETTDSMFTGVSAIAGRFVAPSQRVASRFVQVQRNVSAAGDDYEPIAAGLGSQVEAVQGLASSLQNATLQLDAAKSSVEEYNECVRVPAHTKAPCSPSHASLPRPQRPSGHPRRDVRVCASRHLAGARRCGVPRPHRVVLRRPPRRAAPRASGVRATKPLRAAAALFVGPNQPPPFPPPQDRVRGAYGWRGRHL